MMFQDFGHMENCHKNPNIFMTLWDPAIRIGTHTS